jgi:hypothetical protein
MLTPTPFVNTTPSSFSSPQAFRFTSVFEHHVEHLYACLRSGYERVRRHALLAICYATAKGMLKANGPFPHIGMLVADEDVRCAELARAFFQQLHEKEKDAKSPILIEYPALLRRIGVDCQEMRASILAGFRDGVVALRKKYAELDAQDAGSNDAAASERHRQRMEEEKALKASKDASEARLEGDHDKIVRYLVGYIKPAYVKELVDRLFRTLERTEDGVDVADASPDAEGAEQPTSASAAAAAASSAMDDGAGAAAAPKASVSKAYWYRVRLTFRTLELLNYSHPVRPHRV